MKSLDEKRRELVEELGLIEDPHERLGYIIDRGRMFPALDEPFRTEVFRIEGCMSMLWMVPEMKAGRCYFRADADSAITKGIASLVCEFYSEALPSEVVAHDTGFLGEVGVTQHLSPNRRNGLANIEQKIHGFAQLYLDDKGAEGSAAT